MGDMMVEFRCRVDKMVESRCKADTKVEFRCKVGSEDSCCWERNELLSSHQCPPSARTPRQACCGQNQRQGRHRIEVVRSVHNDL